MATCEEYFLKLFLILAVSASQWNLALSHLRELKTNDNKHVMKRDLNTFLEYNDKSPLVHTVKKRATQDQKVCNNQEEMFKNKINTTGFKFHIKLDNDSLGNLALAWSSESQLLAVTTEEDFFTSKQSQVYFSSDNGKTFVNINKDLQDDSETVEIHASNGLQKHTNDPKRIYLVGYGSGRKPVLFKTTNGGEKFQMIRLPFELIYNIIFHPSQDFADYLLVVDDQENLWLSTDNAETWNKIKENVVSAKWSATGPENPDNQDDSKTIYCAVRVQTDEFDIAALFGLKTASEDNDLEKSTDLGKTWTKKHLHVYSFGIQGKFIYVSVFLTAESEKLDNRIMEVSTDGGNTWSEVQLPSVNLERFYSILEMTDNMVFIHVDEPGNTGFGTLYVSDSTGVLYTESLRNHLYPNFIDLTDFYPVSSMRGVYLASQMEDDQSIHSMISYDRGAEWQPIERPKDEPCKDENKACYLQIHNLYSMHSGIRASLPLSVPSAQGLILVHGHVASALQTTPPDVYITTDGGYQWRKTLDGPHHYQIADQGGLLVAVPIEEFPKVVKFSTDEGHCWHDYTFTTEDIYFTGLLTAPGNTEMNVAIWGYGKLDKIWRIHTLDFEKIITNKCTSKDYVQWMPHFKNERAGCFLGVKETFTKMKPDSWCRNDQVLKGIQTKTYCPCISADYDCDYGYHRVGNSENCVLDKMFKGPKIDICLRGHEEEIISLGYHKVPGDKCTNEGNSFHSEEHRLVDMHKVCQEGDRSVLEDEINGSFLNGDQLPADGGNVRSNTMVLITVLTLIILLGVIVVAYFTRKTIFKKGTSYRYSQLNTGDYDQDVTAAVATHTSLYGDDSDEENRPISSSNPSTRVPAALQNGILPKWEMASNKFSRNDTHTTSSSSHPPPVTASNNSSSGKTDTSPLDHDVQFKGSSLVKSYHDDSDVDLLE